MTVERAQPIAELEYYLSSTLSLLNEVDLNHPVYVEGSTVGEILYHSAQAANHWLRNVILKQPYERDQASEFKRQPNIDEIKLSLRDALAACQLFKDTPPQLEQPLLEPITISPGGFIIENNLEALMHVTAHTAEHLGEVSQIRL